MHSEEIPDTQQALVASNKGPNVQLKCRTVPVPNIKDDEVLIRISCSGIWYRLRQSICRSPWANSIESCRCWIRSKRMGRDRLQLEQEQYPRS